MIDTKAYLGRIDLNEPIALTRPFLTRLQKAHLLHVPFENLDIYQNIPIHLHIPTIYNKIVLRNRGGFCYELNGLFYELLKVLGFDVRRISARVFHHGEYAPEYDHLAVVATIDGKEYLTDVGFGEFTFAPLCLDNDEPQHDERGIFRVDRYNETYYRVSRQENGNWLPVYIFENRHRQFPEFESMCRFHQTSPDSPFTHNRMITRPTSGGRITLTDDTLKISQNGQPTEEKPIHHPEVFAHYLLTRFGIRLDE